MTDLPMHQTQDEDSSLRPGDTLADRYQLTHKLGEGGYSVVFAADDLEQYTQVAIKVLRPGVISKDPSALARMRQESHVMSKIDHPHIVKTFDFQSTEDATFLVMERLLGRSIGNCLKLEGPASTQRIYPLVKQILSALDAAHHARILHRDIKPENILLCPSTEAQGGEIAIIVDFGLAKGLDTSGVHDEEDITLVQTRTKGFVGTPRYTPPEQALGDPLGPETDLFALGLVISEWLTGSVRLKGSRHAELMANLVNSDPIDVSDCPSAWRPWLKKILAKRPGDRYQSAREASEALDHILQNPELEGSNRELVFNHATGEFVPEHSSPEHQVEPTVSFLMSQEPLELDLPTQRPQPRRPAPTPQPVEMPTPQPPTDVEPEREEQESPLSIILLTAIAVVAIICVLLFAAIFFGR